MLIVKWKIEVKKFVKKSEHDSEFTETQPIDDQQQ